MADVEVALRNPQQHITQCRTPISVHYDSLWLQCLLGQNVCGVAGGVTQHQVLTTLYERQTTRFYLNVSEALAFVDVPFDMHDARIFGQG